MNNQIFFYILTIFFTINIFSGNAFAQELTTFKGQILDAETKEPLSGAIVKFKNSNIGKASNFDGYFTLSNNAGLTDVDISLLGYNSQSFTIVKNQITEKEILLVPKNIELTEVVIKPGTQKYKKKNNPAVELITEVIKNKNLNTINKSQDYSYKEFEQFIFALNEYDPDKGFLKKYKFLKNYIDTSMIEKKPVLPLSVKEKLIDVFISNNGKTKREVVKAQKTMGLDQQIDQEVIESYINQTVTTIKLTDDFIDIFQNNFVSPLSTSQAVSFYKWYISDTITVNNHKIVQLDFGPFNSRDLGFTGNLFIDIDSNYAVTKAIMNTPKKIDLNWITDFLVEIDYEQDKNLKMWYPKVTKMGFNVSFVDALKLYVEKTVITEDYKIGKTPSNIIELNKPLIYEPDYLDKDNEYWIQNQPLSSNKKLKLDKMMEEFKDVFAMRLITILGNFTQTGNIPLGKNQKTSKFEVGDLRTMYSYNTVEGNRFRAGITTTKNFNEHLFLYGYGAYGSKDRTFKYMGETTWAFKDILKHKDEFPVNNLSLAYQYDMTALGQSFTQAERDNFLMSFTTSKYIKLVYDRNIQLKYHKEFYNGFSYKIIASSNKLRPAGDLRFEKDISNNQPEVIRHLNNTTTSVELRYAYNEKFIQQRRKRTKIASESFISSITFEKGWKNVLASDYDYEKLTLETNKNIWFTPYGKLNINARYEKVWGKVPFPFLISPNANSSFTLQNGTFYLLNPLEFIHDEQISAELYYHAGGLILQRIPIIKRLNLREVFGIRGFYGRLSDKNNPFKNSTMIGFPEHSIRTIDKKPYMEYNIGIENIFKFFRIDYVRRINYLDQPDIKNSGFRISLQFEF